ncbi:ATP synthase subunit g, mitochondrial-like [Mizuhopecten yessoensis]|uniref:ATP synthase subunit g, mitochondrial n=1 Tax=Mizuhopecten yessoensis TaxID=6573 RepID=A0A210Q3U7_MIZYE|nr:ATP synthase subunit g, mitochondrial-like [Mizuhopecten yessoensis]OWF43416.1 ATP synthase subunit g, mitochondrial [Mizuhopecten yessoensis]
MAAMAKKLNPLMLKGAELAKAQQPRLIRYWNIAKVEFAPPGLADGPQISKGFRQAIDYKRIPSLTMKQVIINGFVCAEIFVLYHIGRIVGKRSLVGFSKIEGCNSFSAMKKT